MVTKRIAFHHLAAGLVILALLISVGCQNSPAAPTAASAPAAAPTVVPAAAPPTAAQAPAPTAAAAAAAPTNAPAQAAAAPAPVAETLKIGIIEGLTGNQSRMGTNGDRFVRMGIDDLNAKGGITVGGKTYRLEPITVDDKSTAEGGRDAANRLVLAEKVKIVMGIVAAALAGAQPVLEPAKVLTFGLTALDRSLGPNFPMTLQMYSHSIMRTNAIYDWLVQDRPTVKRIALVNSDDPTGRSAADASTKKAKELGMTVVSTDYYTMDIKDFTPLVTRVLMQNPDAIDLGIAGGRPALFLALMKSLNEQKYRGQVFATSADATTMKENPSVMEGFVTSVLTDFRSPVNSPAARDVAERYVQKYGASEIEMAPEINYDSASLLAQAVQKVGSIEDTQKLADTLRAGKWDTMYGKRGFVGAKTFGLPAVLEQPIYLARVDGGKVTTFKAQDGTIP